jgi:hypothetical protein
MQLYFSDDKEDTDDLKEDEFASALVGTFTGNSTAKISAFIKVQLPAHPDKLIELHRDWKRPYNVVMDMMRNQVSVGIKSVSPLFTPEEAFVDKRPEFQSLSREVMERGEFKTFTTDIVISADSSQKQKQVKLVVTKDSLGREDYIVVKPSIFTKYDISILQFDIKDFAFDEKTAALIAAKKEFEQQRVAARSEAETAVQREKTIKAQAEAAIAQKEGEAKVQLIQEVTEARKAFEVAQYEAKRADENAKKIIAEGRAEAEAARLKVAAGLTPLEKANIEKETAIGIAQAFAQTKFPDNWVIIGGGSNSQGGGKVDPWTVLGVEAFKQINNQYKSK